MNFLREFELGLWTVNTKRMVSIRSLPPIFRPKTPLLMAISHMNYLFKEPLLLAFCKTVQVPTMSRQKIIPLTIFQFPFAVK